MFGNFKLTRIGASALVCCLMVSPLAASDHWAFQPIRRSALPVVHQRDWPHNAIDYFTLHQMEKRGLTPAPMAGPEAFLRRTALDLTGLPPTWAEVERLRQLDSPQQRRAFVEQLLLRPQYGERMATIWMDLARYADTHGYHMDAHREMWPWRDWVIDAFNRGQPFDQFTIEQLAGDLLPQPSRSQQIATGFNRNHMINFEDGSLADEFRAEYVADRVVTTSTVWLGLTMSCARCHDHKYDPLSQADFYRLFAFFNQVPEHGIDGDQGNAQPYLAAPTPEQTRQQRELEHQLAAVEAQMRARLEAARASRQQWETRWADGRRTPPAPQPLLHLSMDPLPGDAGPAADGWAGTPRWVAGRKGKAVLLDGSTHFRVEGVLDEQTSLTLAAWVFPTTRDAMTIVAKARFDEHPRGYEMALRNGRLTARAFSEPLGNEVEVVARQPLLLRRWQHVAVSFDGSGKAAGIQLTIDGALQPAEVVQDALRQPVRTSAPLMVGGPEHPFRGLLDDVQVFDRALDGEALASLAGADPLSDVLAKPPQERSEEEVEQLCRQYLLQSDASFAEQDRRRQELSRDLAALQRQFPTVMVMREQSPPRPTHVLEQGRYDQPGRQVTAGTPGVLPPLAADQPVNRLSLARWLVHPRHPLTARVAVNRLWQQFFGQGLVPTADDFGTQGMPPTHPALLDWLAAELIDSGWDLKHVQRLIVTSATYQQRHSAVPLAAGDSDNRWLSSGPRQRLTAEMIRDAALQCSGLLVRRIGGPSVYPYQPAGLWEDVSYDPTEFTAQVYVPSRGADLYRRSLYTFWKRSVPPPGMAVFDAPSRETCVVTRQSTTTPQQALTLMNDPTYVEAARVCSERAWRQAGSDRDARLTWMIREILGREADAATLQVLRKLYEGELSEFRAQPQTARALLNVGDAAADPRLPAEEVAAGAVAASVLFQSEEFLFKP